MVFTHTPQPSHLCSSLTSESDMSFLLSVKISNLSGSIPCLIDSGASSNFIDTALAASSKPPKVALERPIALSLFDGKPTTSGFIHEAIQATIFFPDSTSQTLCFLITQLHPAAQIVLGLPWLRTTNPTIDWAALSLSFPATSDMTLPTMSIAMSCTTRKVDPSIVLPSVFSSIPELCVESIIDHSTSHNEIPGNDPSSRSSGYVPKIPWQTSTDPAATDPLASDRPMDPLSSIPSTSLTYNSKTTLGASSEPIIFSLPSDTTCHQKSTRTYVAPSKPFPFANSSIPTPTRSQRQLPSISIAGAASFQKLIDSGEEVYALNIRAIPEPPIEALRVIAHIPAPTSSLYTEALPEDEAEMIAKVVPAEYHEFVDVFSREEAKAMPPH